MGSLFNTVGPVLTIGSPFNLLGSRFNLLVHRLIYRLTF